MQRSYLVGVDFIFRLSHEEDGGMRQRDKSERENETAGREVTDSLETGNIHRCVVRQ